MIAMPLTCWFAHELWDDCLLWSTDGSDGSIGELFFLINLAVEDSHEMRVDEDDPLNIVSICVYKFSCTFPLSGLSELLFIWWDHWSKRIFKIIILSGVSMSLIALSNGHFNIFNADSIILSRDYNIFIQFIFNL